MTVTSYNDLHAWQRGMDLVEDIYRATATFPKDELYGLTSQLRRAAVSIPSNIAEGQGRLTRGEFIQFLGHARGSLQEMRTQLEIASDLKYLADSDLSKLENHSDQVSKMLNGLIDSMRTPKKAAEAR